MSPDKRKRCANFTEDEKLRFLRILQNKGHVIISKVNSHDIKTNRLKEEAWTEVTNDLNATAGRGTVLRTTKNLKKLWQKMKTEAKTFNSNACNQTRGTGGGLPKKLDDPVLELVAEITGRGSSGIESGSDCDYKISLTNTDLDLRASTPALSHNSIHDSQSSIDLQDEATSYLEVDMDMKEKASKTQRKDKIKEVNVDVVKLKRSNTKDNNHLTRHRVALGHNENERSKIQAKHVRLSNSFASECLKCEKEKMGFMELQKQHMIELHVLKLKQAEIKTQIMDAVLKKIQVGPDECLKLPIKSSNLDEKPVDPAIVKAIMTDTN